MRPVARLRRATAALATAALAFTAVAAGLVAPASAAGAGFVVDDFAGTSMGTRTLLPQGEWSCDVTGATSLTPGTGTLKVDVRVPDPLGCTYGQAQLVWTADGTVDLEQGGADRIEIRYRDVTPNQPSAVTFGLQVTDVNGRVAQVGGLSRNGGAASDWLTVRYTPAYVGDVAVLSFPSGFDRSRVTSVALLIAATAANQSVSVTLEGITAGDAEPTYQAPAFGSTAPLVFPASTETTRTVTVTGNPAPDVTVTGGTPSWMTVQTSKAGTTTTVSLSGNPGTSYAETGLTLRADVAGSLTTDATIPVVVPSPVVVAYGSANPTLGVAGPTALGTATSTPGSRVLGPTTGLPPGTALELVGTDVRLTGTATATGTYTVATTVGNDYRSTSFSRQVVVGQEPSVAPLGDQHVVRGEPLSIPVTVAGYPAPSVQVAGLPAGLGLADGAITGTPTTAGTSTVSVTATNAWGTSSTSFAMSVGTRPTVAAPATTLVTAGESTSLPVPVSGDPDSVTATGLPAGLQVERSGSTVTLTGTPTRPTDAALTSGTATITARNNYATATATWSWTLQAAPELAGPATATTAVGSALVGAQLVATGHPAPSLSVQGEASLPAGLSLDVTTPGTVSVVGTPTASGTAVLELTADNGVGDPVVRTLTVHALAGPSFADAAPRLTVAAGSSDELVLGWDGHTRPTLTLGSTLPAWLTFSAADGAFEASPPAGVAGLFGPYAVTATNAAGSAVANVTVEVTAAPTVTRQRADLEGAVDVALGTWQVATYAGFPAPAVTVTGLPAGVAATTTGGVVTIAGTPTQSGAFSATITATNAHGSDSTTFTVEVTAPPTLSAPPTVTVPRGVTATLPVTVGGYPRPVLVATGLPAGLVLDGAAGTVSGAPLVAGTFDVELSLERDGAPVPGSAVTLTLDVTAPPTFATAPTGTTVRLGVPVDVAAFEVAGHPTPAATAAGLPTGLALSQTGTSVRLVGTPTQRGTYDVELRVTSAVGTHTAAWRVVVGEPATLTGPADVLLTLGDDVDETFAATGYPAPTVTATGLPAGLAWVPAAGGGRLVGTPQAAGTSTVTLTARNGVAADAVAELTLVVELGDVAVVLGAPSARSGAGVDIHATGLQPNEKVEVWLHSTPQLLATTAADASGTVRLTVTVPAGTPAGSHTVVLVAASGATARVPFEVLPAATSAAAPTASPTRGAGPGLAATGSDVGVLLAAALLAMAGGAALLVVRRRRA